MPKLFDRTSKSSVNRVAVTVVALLALVLSLGVPAVTSSGAPCASDADCPPDEACGADVCESIVGSCGGASGVDFNATGSTQALTDGEQASRRADGDLPPAWKGEPSDPSEGEDPGAEPQTCCVNDEGVPTYRIVNGRVDPSLPCRLSLPMLPNPARCPEIDDPGDESSQCCQGPDGSLYRAGSRLYSERTSWEERQVPDRVCHNNRWVPAKNGVGDVVEHTESVLVRTPEWAPCPGDGDPNRDHERCECVEVECCEDSETGDLYAKNGMPDGSETVLWRYREDPCTRQQVPVQPATCGNACPGSTKVIGMCAREEKCDLPPARSLADTSDGDEGRENEKPKDTIPCDQCPTDPEEARGQLCDPCGSDPDGGLTWQLSGDIGMGLKEARRMCKEYPEAFFDDFEKMVEAVKAKLRDWQAKIDEATAAMQAEIAELESKVDRVWQAAFSPADFPGGVIPPELEYACGRLTGASQDSCIADYQAKVNTFIDALAKVNAAQAQVLRSKFNGALAQATNWVNGQVNPARARLRAFISNSYKPGDMSTAYDNMLKKLEELSAGESLGKCMGRMPEDIERCVEDYFSKLRENFNRLRSVCKKVGNAGGISDPNQCDLKYCDELTAEQAAKKRLDDLETLPGDTWEDEVPKGCCTNANPDFLVNSSPKTWEAGQFFERKTRLGSFGWGWSTYAGRNLWVSLVDNRGDVGSWVALSAGLIARLPSVVGIRNIRMPNPACLIDHPTATQTCLTDPKVKVPLGANFWLGRALGQANARFRYNPREAEGKYEAGFEVAVKILEESVWSVGWNRSGTVKLESAEWKRDLFKATFWKQDFNAQVGPVPVTGQVGIGARVVLFARFGPSRSHIGLQAEAGVGGGVVAWGQIGLGYGNNWMRIFAGLSINLVIIDVRAGARLSGGVKQLPPTSGERQIVYAGFCFSVPYSMRMFDGDVSGYAELSVNLKLGWLRIKYSKTWSKQILKWEGVGLAGNLWKRCELKCYSYDGQPDIQPHPIFPPPVPPKALPGADAPPCWPNYKYEDVHALINYCDELARNQNKTDNQMCDQNLFPPECVDYSCGLANVERTGKKLMQGAEDYFAQFERDEKLLRDTLSAAWDVLTLEEEAFNTAAGQVANSAVATLRQNCKAPSKSFQTLVKGTKASRTKLGKDWEAYGKCLEAQLPALRALALGNPQIAALVANIQRVIDSIPDVTKSLADWEDLLARLQDTTNDLNGLLNTEDCSCNYDASELGTMGSPLAFRCGGESCNGAVCNDPCPPAYPGKDSEGRAHYPNAPDPPFSSNWRWCPQQ